MFTNRDIIGLITFAMPGVAFAQCNQWETIPTPNPASVNNVFTDAESNAQALHALLIADDVEEFGNPVDHHVLRREAGEWIDLGTPILGQLDGPPDYFAIHADEQGSVWLGGTSEADASRPVITQFDGNWLPPQEIDLVNQVDYPFYERGGQVNAIDTAPDGTMFAVGRALNYGLTDDSSVPLFLVNSGCGWNEVTQPETDWPGNYSENTFLDDVIAFSSDNVWAVGWHAVQDGVYPNGALIVHWDGSSLSIIQGPEESGEFLNHPLRAMAANGPDDIWAVGGYVFNPQTSTIAHYDGTSWTRIESPVSTPLWNIAIDDDGTAWATAPNFTADLAYFDGKTWSAVTQEETGASITTAARDADGTMWLLGGTSDLESLALKLDCGCAADMSGSANEPDGQVDTQDLLFLLSAWGPCVDGCADSGCSADLDNDCSIGTSDLLMLLGEWGTCSN